MEPEQISQWYFQPEPFCGESFSHFLGRYCLMNCIAPNALAQHLQVGAAAVSRWRKLRYNPPLSEKHIQQLVKVTGISQDTLRLLLPHKPMQIGTIRLCAACYAMEPYHRMHWQYKATQYCEQHELGLLSRCPFCKASFPIPAEWGAGICLRCGNPFADLAKFQKQVTVP